MISKKKILPVILCCVTVLMAGCGREVSSFRNKDGSILSYNSVSELSDGYYVMKKNGVVHPTLKQGISQEQPIYMWYTGFDNLIPEVSKGDSVIFISDSDKPTAFDFLRMANQGKTLGIRFDIDVKESGDMVENTFSFPKDDTGYCPYSPVKKFVQASIGANSDSNIEISKINNKKVSPLMFTSQGFLKGLSGNSMYKVGYYKGTKYKEVDIKSDTRLFTYLDTYSSNSYKETKKGYFIIDIPNDLPNGYYLIGEMGSSDRGYGLFKYTGNTSSSETEK